MKNLFPYIIFEKIELLNTVIYYGEGCRLTFPTIKIRGHQVNFGRSGAGTRNIKEMLIKDIY